MPDYLDTSLLELLSTAGKSQWTIRNAVEGVQIFGGIGSGKTSGSGRTLALKYLTAGFGGLVLTAKPDEKDIWDEYCALTNRGQDLIVVEPGRSNYFNFIDYESSHSKDDNVITENIVEVLKTVINASEEKSGHLSNEKFWDTALDMLIFNLIDLCKLAYGKVSVEKLFDIMQSLPKSDQPLPDLTPGKQDDKQSAYQSAYIAANQKTDALIDAWSEKQSLVALNRFRNNWLAYSDAVRKAIPQSRLMENLDMFFNDTFWKLSEKTRSIIEFSFSGFLFRLLRDPVYSLFCRHASTFTPEDCWQGKVILINLPVKLYHKVGRDCQILFKYCWQRAMEKRNVKTDGGRPVFLWADEAQHFLHEHDADYQATARSSRIATVYISQNLPNYHASMGGERSDYRVKSFLGTLNTKIFHANADIETNRYASELIGDAYYEDPSFTRSFGEKVSGSSTISHKSERMVRPEKFASLMTGGVMHDKIVTAFVHLQSTVLTDGSNHIKVKFRQDFKPRR